MIVSPTMKLRWVQKDIAENNCYALMPKSEYNPGYAKSFVLQQYWKDDEGGGEWMDIEIEWNPELNKSK